MQVWSDGCKCEGVKGAAVKGIKTRQFPVLLSSTWSVLYPFRWIDLLRVQDVRKARSEAQDKTNLTFEVITDGRVYELLAENATDMDK